ncbi:hypothetical protein NC653_005681 [Populus alba x Populus x berolinensis]|uniref:Uncharacterized protein n=1 Tax=Populus alba x Populus x berolinensis TaxID=444605 RepID=A0AAD6RCV0_9ROSI|nr:hypothetical protein NC653_005681 [Populus alba x Populus x berolinensis]
MEMNRSVLYWVVSTSREQYSLQRAFDGENNGDAIYFFSCHH